MDFSITAPISKNAEIDHTLRAPCLALFKTLNPFTVGRGYLYTYRHEREKRERKIDAFLDARGGSRKGVSIRKSRCTDVGMTLENSIRRLII